MARGVVLSEETARRVLAAVEKIEGTPAKEIGKHRKRFPVSVGGSSTGGAIRAATITNVFGTSHAARYDAEAVGDASITVTSAEPLYRPVDTTIDIQAAPIGAGAILVSTGSAWRLWMTDEYILTTECEGQSGTGVDNESGDVNTASEAGRGKLHQTVLTTDGFGGYTHSVTTGNSNRQGKLMYTFPADLILIKGLYVSLTLSAPSATNNIRVGVGTTSAAGTSGTTLTAAQTDVALSANLGALTSGGTTGTRKIPLDLPGDHDNIQDAYDGTGAGGVSLYFNFCPTANWNAADDITVQYDVQIDWVNLSEGVV